MELTKRQKQIKAITLFAAIAAISEQLDEGNQVEVIDVELSKEIQNTVAAMEVFMKDWADTPEAHNNTPEGAQFLKECIEQCLIGINYTIS
jgi:hypothetical protein